MGMVVGYCWSAWSPACVMEYVGCREVVGVMSPCAVSVLSPCMVICHCWRMDSEMWQISALVVFLRIFRICVVIFVLAFVGFEPSGVSGVCPGPVPFVGVDPSVSCAVEEFFFSISPGVHGVSAFWAGWPLGSEGEAGPFCIFVFHFVFSFELIFGRYCKVCANGNHWGKWLKGLTKV